MRPEVGCEAIRTKRVLELRYDGYFRRVEVHAVGFTRDGNAIMRVWQTEGGSVSGERIGWKLMRLDETFTAIILNAESKAPRHGYARNDTAMAKIVCQI